MFKSCLFMALTLAAPIPVFEREQADVAASASEAIEAGEAVDSVELREGFALTVPLPSGGIESGPAESVVIATFAALEGYGDTAPIIDAYLGEVAGPDSPGYLGAISFFPLPLEGSISRVFRIEGDASEITFVLRGGTGETSVRLTDLRIE